MPIEPFSGGLVNAGDPSLLREGELQLTNDCTYRPQDLALWSAAGRTEFNNTPLTDPLGLVYCGFDDGDSVLLAQTKTGLHTSPVAETGTFTEVATTVSSAPIQVVQYMNRNFLFDGANRQVLLKDGSIRTHGMKAVETLCMIRPYISANNSRFWVDETVGVIGGWYEYWTTEVYIDKTNDNDEFVEGTFTRPSEIATIELGGVGQGQVYIPKNVDNVNNSLYTNVEITRPLQINSNATHWNIYRSPKKSDPKIGGFPTGVLINEHPIPIAQLTAIDAGATWTNIRWASTTGASNTFERAYGAYGAYENSTNPETYVYLHIASNGGTGMLALGGYGFTDIEAPVTAIEVHSYMTANGADNAIWTMALYGTTTGVQAIGPTGTQFVPQVREAACDTVVNGISVTPWTPVDIESLEVRLHIVGIVVSAHVEVGVDAIGIRVKYGGYGDGGYGVFPAVIVEDSGAMVGRGRNGQPPIATTGDILQDRLVTNDISEPMVIRYTTPGQLDYFAEQYWLPCSTKDRDEVVCIRTLGNITIVGLKDKLFRVMFLPSENDYSFTRGDALECFSMERGIISSRGACVFQMEGQPLMLACVDQQGIYMTDGYKVYTLSDDIDWTSMVEVSDLDTCELVCNPTEFKFSLYYNPKV